MNSDGSVVYQLADPHGNIVATSDNQNDAPLNYQEYTEYGLPRDASAANARYGWLGSAQRATNETSGLVQMGVRLYDPVTGGFGSTDPIDGSGPGSTYEYGADDPVNETDPSGNRVRVSMTCKVRLQDPHFSEYFFKEGFRRVQIHGSIGCELDVVDHPPFPAASMTAHSRLSMANYLGWDPKRRTSGGYNTSIESDKLSIDVSSTCHPGWWIGHTWGVVVFQPGFKPLKRSFSVWSKAKYVSCYSRHE